MTVRTSGQAAGMPSTKNGDWTHYTADVRGTKYSPLDQINAANFNKLEVAWRFKTDNLGTRPEFKLEGTPLAIKGVLYTTAGTRRSVVALDGKTGELIWAHSYREGNRAAIAPRQLSGRGVSYWTDGKGDERILYVTTGYRLIALNAKNGAMIPSFGENGVVDLKKGAVFGKGQQIDLETGEIGLHSTPTVVKDVVIVGSSFKEGMTVMTHNNTKGLVRAFDVKSGQAAVDVQHDSASGRVRQRHVGERVVGDQRQHRRVDADHGRRGGRAGVPAGRDADVGLLRRPSPGQQPVRREPGVRRPEDRRSASGTSSSSTTASGITTCRRPRCSPTSTRTARSIKAVAVPSKQSYAYVFDRVTGQPVWPIVETPVPASRRARREGVADAADSDGRARQAVRPTRAPFVNVPDDVIDFTPELRAEALENLKRYRARELAVRAAHSRRRERPARHDQHRQHGRRHQLAGRRPRSGAHIFYLAGQQFAGDDRLARRAAAGVQDRYPVRRRA